MNEKQEEQEDKTAAIIGLELIGFGRKIDPYYERGIFVFDKNSSQHSIKKNARCKIKTPKKQTILPYPLKDLNIKWGKKKEIFGYELYCECEDCKEPGKTINIRYLKMGKKHGQSAIFEGEYSFSFVLIPTIYNKRIKLTKRYTLEKITESKPEENEEIDKSVV